MSSPRANQVFSRRLIDYVARFAEMYFWFLIAIVVGGRALFLFVLSPPQQARFVFQEYYSEIAITVLVLIFPLMFKLIFGQLPFEFIRRRQFSNNPLVEKLRTTLPVSPQPGVENDTVKISTNPVNSKFQVLENFALQARERARDIYLRAGVYLITGVFVAFSGLLFFYSLTIENIGQRDIYGSLILLLPKFGILFFIELVAFFFLKQYRSAMDEFRYYDAIARVREEVLALLEISSLLGSPISPLDLVKYDAYFSHGGILANGQSTELLEAKKLEGSELETINKLVGMLAKKIN